MRFRIDPVHLGRSLGEWEAGEDVDAVRAVRPPHHAGGHRHRKVVRTRRRNAGARPFTRQAVLTLDPSYRGSRNQWCSRSHQAPRSSTAARMLLFGSRWPISPAGEPDGPRAWLPRPYFKGVSVPPDDVREIFRFIRIRP